MFDPQAVAKVVVDSARQHPLQWLEHVVALSSSLVASLAVAQRILQALQVWARQWWPNTQLGFRIGQVEYGVEATTDLVEIFALNWRQWIAPKPREVWDTSKRQEQLGEAPKADAAGAGK